MGRYAISISNIVDLPPSVLPFNLELKFSLAPLLKKGLDNI